MHDNNYTQICKCGVFLVNRTICEDCLPCSECGGIPSCQRLCPKNRERKNNLTTFYLKGI